MFVHKTDLAIPIDILHTDVFPNTNRRYIYHEGNMKSLVNYHSNMPLVFRICHQQIQHCIDKCLLCLYTHHFPSSYLNTMRLFGLTIQTTTQNTKHQQPPASTFDLKTHTHIYNTQHTRSTNKTHTRTHTHARTPDQ
jgi:hypothetical protein